MTLLQRLLKRLSRTDRPWSFLKGVVLGTVAALISACAVGPNFVRPSPPDASRYTREPLAALTLEADGHAQAFAADSTLRSEWWRLFNSPALNAVVQLSIVGNPTLQAAEASLRQSQDNVRAGYGLYFPKADAQLDASRQRVDPVLQGEAAPGTVFNLVTLTGTVSYVFDVFGGERRTVEGLRAQADYQRYTGMAAYLTLTTNVVDACIARAAYEAEVRETEQLLILEHQQLHLAEVQFRSGKVPYSALLAIRNLIAGNQALLAPLRQRIDQTEGLLATLEGLVPSRVVLPEIDLTALAVPGDLPIGVPSELVRQRPDILAAEAQLHAANANIGVATAALFPSFSLSGAYGAGASSFSRLSESSARFWSIGPSATIPLFQGGTLWYARKAAIDEFQTSEANYRGTVLNAFAEVSDSLRALEHDAEGLQAQVDALGASREALRMLQANFSSGLIAYADVLVGEIQVHAAAVGYFQAIGQRHQDTVALFAALGGGWSNVTRTSGGSTP